MLSKQMSLKKHSNNVYAYRIIHMYIYILISLTRCTKININTYSKYIYKVLKMTKTQQNY